jgi:hypothetical protein
MNLFPERSFELNYRATPDELLDKLLQNVIKPWNAIKIRKNGRQFTGIVTKNGFELYLRSGYRTSFRPMIFGKVSATPYGTKIVVRIGYKKLEYAFTMAFLGVIMFFAGRGILSTYFRFSFMAPEMSDNMVGLILATGVIGYLFVLLWLSFKSESNKSIKILKSTFSNAKKYDEK